MDERKKKGKNNEDRKTEGKKDLLLIMPFI